MNETPSDAGRMADLRRWNVGVGIIHLVQAILILALSSGFAIAVVTDVQLGPPGTTDTDRVTFFDVAYGPAVAAFLLLAAVDHLMMASPGVVRWYERNLRAGINYARWIEYSFSASLMVVLIAMLTGITDLYALLGLFGVNAGMILLGLIMERVNRDRSSVDWWPFVFGSILGVVPWIAIGTAIAVSSDKADGVPGFVYGIFVSLFLLFSTFAVNQWLQYRGRGRFADYLFGEKVYLVLSLAAKSALAWQVFGGTLAD